MVNDCDQYCSICENPIVPSSVRPYTLAYCAMEEESSVSCLCHKCSVSSWINTYRVPSIEKVQYIMNAFHTSVSRLINEDDITIMSYFSDINEKLSVKLYQSMINLNQCYHCGQEAPKMIHCKNCKHAAFCSHKCLKTRHSRFQCKHPFFIASVVYK